MPNGKTTLTSPIYDITKLENPLIRFYQWFTNLAFNAFPNRAAFWQIDLSSDGGETWVTFEETKANFMIWTKRQINVEQYIQEALTSVLAQTYLNLEIIVVDDESPDQSIALIKRCFNDSRIRIIQQKNRGLAGARNTGIRHANGEYVAFLDSDDFWQSDKIEEHIRLMKANPSCGVSLCSSLFVDDQSQSLGRLQAPKKKRD